MNKVIALILCVTAGGAGLFALGEGGEQKGPPGAEGTPPQRGDRQTQKGPFSVGAGVIFEPGFQTIKMEDGFSVEEINTSTLGGGPSVFFDAKYAEASFSLLFGNTKGNKDSGADTTDLLIGILGKYPFRIKNILLFPLIGIDYRVNIGASSHGAKVYSKGASDYFNALSMLGGLGVDYGIGDTLYLRGELGCGFVFNSKSEENVLKNARSKDMAASSFEGKIFAKLAAGFRF